MSSRFDTIVALASCRVFDEDVLRVTNEFIHTGSSPEYLKELHYMFRGTQDEHFAALQRENNKQQLYSEFVENIVVEEYRPIQVEGYRPIQEVEGRFANTRKRITFQIPQNMHPPVSTVALPLFLYSDFVIKDIAVNIAFDLIDNVSLRLGDQIVERLDPKWFDVLHFVYNIEKADGRIPFYLGNMGIPLAYYHTVEIIVTLKEPIGLLAVQTPNLNFKKYNRTPPSLLQTVPQTRTRHHITNERAFCQSSMVSRIDKRFYIKHPVTHLFVAGDLRHLELSVVGRDSGTPKRIVLGRIKQIGHYSLFSFVSSLDDFEHTINFSWVDTSFVTNDCDLFVGNDTPIIAINRQILCTGGGMYAVRWAG